MSHTPGPWRIETFYARYNDQGCEIAPEHVSEILGANNEPVCGTCDGCNKITIPDARLIEAAPEMFTLLLALQDAPMPEHIRTAFDSVMKRLTVSEKTETFLRNGE